MLGDDNRFLVPMMERWVREQVVDAKQSLGRADRPRLADSGKADGVLGRLQLGDP